MQRKRGQEYYQGMLNSPLDFRADEDLDNITPNMKLVMGASSFGTCSRQFSF